MAQQPISTKWDRDNRNAMEHNFTELYGKVANVVDNITDEVVEQIIDSAKLVWQSPIDTYEDIATTYPNPEIGWAVMCRDDSADYPSGEGDMRKAGTVWRYDGTEWKAIQQIDPTMINEVDIRLTNEVEKKVDYQDLFSDNDKMPVKLELNDFSGYNEPYHPSVLYLKNGFAGYNYWLVQSPYPLESSIRRDRWEVPVVYKSNDGVNWITVANPLDDLTQSEIDNGDYMSDPHLVFREDTNTLEVWYRYTENATGLPTKIIRKTTTDAENWTEREELVPPKINTSTDFMRSPSIIWDNVNKVYRAWYQNDYGLYYNTSPDGKNWGQQVELSLDTEHSTWHLDVNFYNGEYHLLSYSKTKQDIWYYSSHNGIDFEFERILLSLKDDDILYSRGLYRAISLLDHNNKIRVYSSAVTSENKTAIIMMLLYRKIKESVIEQTVRVFPVNTFTIDSLPLSFPAGSISQNIISDDSQGLPGNAGGLLITDRTSEKSSSGLESNNTVFQTFKESGSGDMYTRISVDSNPDSWSDFRKINTFSRDNVDVVYNTANKPVSVNTATNLTFDTLTSSSGTATYIELDEYGKIIFKEPGVYLAMIKVVFETDTSGIRKVMVSNSGNVFAQNALLEGETIIDISSIITTSAPSTVLNIWAEHSSNRILNVIGGNSWRTSVRIIKI